MQENHLDVLIVGAGLSGIGAAYHLQSKCPGKSYAILEARERLGGTWDLFRYPGIRSDSDMYTLGYSFRPWTNPKSIADGPSILEYLKDTAAEYGIDKKIRYQHKVVGADWKSDEGRWHVEVEHAGEVKLLTAQYFFVCSGYYRYDAGYTPEFEGRDDFAGDIVHPQHWPEDLDYAGKKVVVIGSGATAVTLVPSMADEAGHVTMLQRSPTYMVAGPSKDKAALWLREKLGDEAGYEVARWKNVALSMLFYNASRKFPEQMKKLFIGGIRKSLGEDFDVDTHFTPKYKPWDQRLCLVPEGDLFRQIKKGNVSVVTDHIERFTEKGILLRGGDELEADIVVTATGLQLQFLGGATLSIDGNTVDMPSTMTYKGMMLSDVPNMMFAVGYTNASWTLKVDLAFEYMCRLLNHMDERGYSTCIPRRDPAVAEEPLLDFSAGYVLRTIHEFPRGGDQTPWKLYQNYALDRMTLRHGDLEDGTMEFVRGEVAHRPGSKNSGTATGKLVVGARNVWRHWIGSRSRPG